MGVTNWLVRVIITLQFFALKITLKKSKQVQSPNKRKDSYLSNNSKTKLKNDKNLSINYVMDYAQ